MKNKEIVKRGFGGSVTGLVLVCFFFSGMTGLVYEILWTRMIVKIIGGAPFAVSIVLTVFMAGLGLGSFIAGRMIDKIRQPAKLVRLYGILELAIGGYCLFLPVLLMLFLPVYRLLYNNLFEHFMLYSFLTFVGCSLLLIIPAICMGATLPILCRFYVSRLSHLSGHIGRLYGLNTIGAAFGALACGFWLINYLGMPGTLAFAIIANGIIGLVSIAASYRLKADIGLKEPVQQREEKEQGEQSVYKGAAAAALIIFAVSGFCSMAYEVIWAKLLGLLIGPTTYSFTIVLVTFITGLALGSMLFGWLGDKVKRPVWLLIYTQLAAGLLALSVSQLLGSSQFFFAKLIYHFQDSFFLLHILKAAILFCFILPPTLCLGATFPLVGKIYTRSLTGIGKSVGTAYAVNTIGAVLGSFCAGFILIPFLGKENGLRLVFGIQIFTALVFSVRLLLLNKHKLLRWIPITVPAAAALVLCFYFPSWNRTALSEGRYHRSKELVSEIQNTGWLKALHQGSKILAEQKTGEVVYYGDGIGGFTTVTKTVDAFGNSIYTMLNSGKADASSRDDMSTQALLAHFPMIFHPNPKTVMVLGHASGITSGEVLCYPVERLDVLEISREVVKASRFFNPWNGNVLRDRRTELIIQDGRAHLQLTDRKYDVIISEPSNPWMAGLATLFTRDFFELVKNQLNEDGILCQWIHSYQMDWNTFSMVGRTFADVFANSMIAKSGKGDYLLIGFKGREGLRIANARRNAIFARRSRNVSLPNPRLFYKLIATEFPGNLFGDGSINSDNRPLLEFSAPKNMYTKDPTIHNRINSDRTVRAETAKMITEATNLIDAQVDFAEFAFSVHNPFPDMVDIERASPEQKQRFFKIVEDYCADNNLDYSVLSDKELKARCRTIQIEAIRNKLPVAADKALAYYTLGNLCRESWKLEEAQGYYTRALELSPEHAELHNNLAIVFHYQGRLHEALEHYDKSLRLRPDYEIARENRQKVIYQLSKIDTERE